MSSEETAINTSLLFYLILMLAGGIMVLASTRDDVSIIVAAIGLAISAYSIYKIS